MISYSKLFCIFKKYSIFNLTNLCYGTNNIRQNVSHLVLPKMKNNYSNICTTVILENFYVSVVNHFKNPSLKLNKNYLLNRNGLWRCKIVIQWPSYHEFIAEESSKGEAARSASLLALKWLKRENKMNSFGKLIKEEHVEIINLKLDKEQCEAIDHLNNSYISEIKCDFQDNTSCEKQYYFDNEIFPSYNFSKEETITRDRELLHHLNNIPLRTSLVIDKFENQILSSVRDNRVIVLEGATGCGKSTRVPQMLFDHYINCNKGSECNIIVTEPRRISAISLANRIAEERDEKLGYSIGYHIRFSHCYPPNPGSIVFTSTGILLQRLLFDSNLNNISHVIIDEAHERDVNIDLLLLLMKDLLTVNDKLRVIIMSATINAKIFQQYFDNCSLLSIPGSMFNVQTFYLNDDALSQHLPSPILPSKHFYSYDIDSSLIINLVTWIHDNKASGAILVFLPGWSDIYAITKILKNNQDLVVVAAHSKLLIEQQQLIFQQIPIGKRKVILATNIAESSITIPDVVYVIDSGIVREIGHDGEAKQLKNNWISKAVADQRQGRAGRVKEGECYRLYFREQYEELKEYPTPEILRIPLEKFVINLKMHRNDSILNSFRMLLQSPPMKNIEAAITLLKNIDILDVNENVTALGKRVAFFGLHPPLSVALLYSVFFNCVDSMLPIVSYLNEDASMFAIDTKSKERRELLSYYHPFNDFLAFYNLYSKCNTNFVYDPTLLAHFNKKSIEIFNQVSRLYSYYLNKVGLINLKEIEFDEFNNQNFIAPTLLLTTNKLAVNDQPHVNVSKHYFRTIEGQKVKVASSSVNYKNSQNSSTFLTYYNISKQDRLYCISNTAIISPISVMLFCRDQPAKMYEDSESVMLQFPNTRLQIKSDKESYEKLLMLREIVWSCLNNFVRHFDVNVNCNSSLQLQKVQDFENKLRSVLKDLL